MMVSSVSEGYVSKLSVNYVSVKNKQKRREKEKNTITFINEYLNFDE